MTDTTEAKAVTERPVMTLQRAAALALEAQDACNSSGLIKTLAGPVLDAIWTDVRGRGEGTDSVNAHPIVALFLFKLGELGGFGFCTLTTGYEEAVAACKQLAGGAR